MLVGKTRATRSPFRMPRFSSPPQTASARSRTSPQPNQVAASERSTKRSPPSGWRPAAASQSLMIIQSPPASCARRLRGPPRSRWSPRPVRPGGPGIGSPPRRPASADGSSRAAGPRPAASPASARPPSRDGPAPPRPRRRGSPRRSWSLWGTRHQTGTACENGAVVGHPRQRLLLGADADAEDQAVEDAEDDRRQPRRMHQRQGEDLRDHRQIVGMPQEPVRPARNGRGARQDHDPRGPPAVEGGDDPVPQPGRQDHEQEHRNPQRRQERPVEEPDLQGAADQEGGVEEHHPPVMPRRHLDPAPGQQRAPVPPRDPQLDQPAEGGEEDEEGVDEAGAQSGGSKDRSLKRGDIQIPTGVGPDSIWSKGGYYLTPLNGFTISSPSIRRPS